MRYIALALVCAVIVFAIWVRLAPTRAERWHRAPEGIAPGDTTTIGSHAHRRRASAGDLVRLDEIIRATPRTRRIAGSLEEGMLTYETRSRLWGFPDYTTLHLDGRELVIFGRLRFGRGDMGVNKARIEGWLASLDQG